MSSSHLSPAELGEPTFFGCCVRSRFKVCSGWHESRFSRCSDCGIVSGLKQPTAVRRQSITKRSGARLPVKNCNSKGCNHNGFDLGPTGPTVHRHCRASTPDVSVQEGSHAP